MVSTHLKNIFFAPTIPNPRVARVRAAGRPLETPLTVRLWRNCPLSKDQIVGLASKHLQFTLFAVASLNSLVTAACSCGSSCCRQTQRKGLCPCPKVFPQWISDIRKANHHVSLSSWLATPVAAGSLSSDSPVWRVAASALPIASAVPMQRNPSPSAPLWPHP